MSIPPNLPVPVRRKKPQRSAKVGMATSHMHKNTLAHC
jgi:hypothetical protein